MPDRFNRIFMWSQIARFIGPTWGPSGADRTQEGHMLAPWTLLSGMSWWVSVTTLSLTKLHLKMSSVEVSTILSRLQCVKAGICVYCSIIHLTAHSFYICHWLSYTGEGRLQNIEHFVETLYVKSRDTDISTTYVFATWGARCLYTDVIMGAISSQITSLLIVYSTVYLDADQRKHQSSASLAFVWGIHRGPVNSPHKWQVTWKMFPFDDVIMATHIYMAYVTEMFSAWPLCG